MGLAHVSLAQLICGALAGGTAKPGDKSISAEARHGDTRFGICSTTFLEGAFRTDYYRIDITFNDDDSAPIWRCAARHRRSIIATPVRCDESRPNTKPAHGLAQGRRSWLAKSHVVPELNRFDEWKMNELPKTISTVDDACTFIINWFGWSDDLAGSQITLPFVVPQAIQTLNHRLGRLWEDPRACGDVNIFDSQDTLISPHQYEAGPDGVVKAIWENQGVWGCGFKPETGAQLWVTGCWPTDEGCPPTRDDECDAAWRPTQDVIDTAVIFELLQHAVLASVDCQYDDEDEKPDEADRLLWAFAPWADFSGFWTNKDQSLIRMQGWGWAMTARR